jgi:hypothetical protein
VRRGERRGGARAREVPGGDHREGDRQQQSEPAGDTREVSPFMAGTA